METTTSSPTTLPAAPASPPHVVIVGGGFGGLYAARALKHAPVRITLVDRHNYHLFQPLLYQVATAALSPADIASPIRAILRKQRNVEVLLAEAVGVDPERRELILTDGRLSYDYLVLATGARHAYFGHDEWETLAPGLKSVDDALEIRRRIFLAFEAAERESDPVRRQTLLTFVVVGGGPTGVELAGALGEIAHDALDRNFRRIDPGQARILLLDGAPRVLRAYPERLSAKARRQLERLGVEVRTDAIVSGVEADAVSLRSGERIAAGTILWAAGVVASPLGKQLGAPTDAVGRVLVAPDLSVPGHPEIFVIGDLANLAGPDGQPLPGVAQTAIQGGKATGKNIQRLIQGKPTRPFHYRNYGEMATIGRNAAVAMIGPLRLSGFIAWVAWLTIHILWLIGFRNRLTVMLQWSWAYLTHGRAARLITGYTQRQHHEPRVSGPS